MCVCFNFSYEKLLVWCLCWLESTFVAYKYLAKYFR